MGSSVADKSPTLLLLGCGQLGTAVGQHFLERGWRVIGARRSINRLPDNFERLAIDFSSASDIETLGEIQADYVLITLSPDGRSEAAYNKVFQVALSHILAHLNRDSLSHVLFTSSTSVYHQNDGSVVDEESATEPHSYSGRSVLAAEKLLTASGLSASVVRFGGIYGGHSLRLAERVRAGQCAPLQPVHYSNRIHRLDCERVLEHLLDRAARGLALEPCYLAVDDEPAPIAEVHLWLAQQLNVDYNYDNAYRHMAGSKRGCNQRLRASGFEFRYPDYRSGYNAVLAETN